MHRGLTGRRRNAGLRAALVAVAAALLLSAGSLAAGWTWPIKLGTVGDYGVVSSTSVAVSGKVIHVLMEHDGNVTYQRSTNGGVSWRTEVQLAVKSSTTTYRPMAIAVSGNKVGALFGVIGSAGRKSIRIRRSANGGRTWGSAHTIARYSSPETYMAGAGLMVAGSRMLVAWTDGSTGKILARRSTDSGASFQTVQEMGSTTGDSLGFKDGAVTVAAAGSNVYIVWVPTYHQRVVMRRSTNGGATWKSQQTITRSVVTDGLAASASGSTLLVMYDLTGNVVRMARSTDSGRHLHGATISPAHAPYLANDVFISGSRARLVYSDFSPAHVSMRTSSDGGATWGRARRVVTYGSATNVVVSQGHTVLVWGGLQAADPFDIPSVFSQRSN